jgi:hypothetical protein
VGVGPGSIEHCTVSLWPFSLMQCPADCMGTLDSQCRHVLPCSCVQVKAVRLISSAQALVYDDLGTQVLTVNSSAQNVLHSACLAVPGGF